MKLEGDKLVSSVREFFEVVESIVTSGALIAAGIWSYLLFVKRRQRFPRAKISHEVICRPAFGDKWLIHVVVTIDNIGEVLLELEEGFVRVYQMLPVPKSLADVVEAGDDPVSKGEAEIDWTDLGTREFYWQEAEQEIEPGENDWIHSDFAIVSEIETVQVYSYFKNKSKKGREIGWNYTTILDLQHRP